MKAVILAAGISTRLRPLTNNLPKPMLSVMGKPMLEHIVNYLASYGIRDIIITTHYLSERIRDHFGDGDSFGVHIQYAHEDVLLNTAGSLKRLENALVTDFLVVGGNDLLPDLDIRMLYKFHSQREGIGTIVFKRLLDTKLVQLFGQGVLDVDCRLIKFQEKPTTYLSDLVHTTYQMYSPRVFHYIPCGLPFAIPVDLIPTLLDSNEIIYGYTTESPFICISTIEQFVQAQVQLQEALHSHELNKGESL